MKINKIKKTGATFTPQALAIFLAKKITKYAANTEDAIKILDPACGDGSLLGAINKELATCKNQYSLIGYDTNLNYIEDAHNNLNVASNVTIDLRYEDFLLSDIAQSKNIDLFNIECNDDKVDIVIANPPYVRTQILGAERSKKIAQTFNLKGKIDLYFPFIITMTNSLKNGGILGIITSNRYLTTKSGEQIRKYLIDNYELLEIIDLGDTKIFDAAVLPAILIARKRTAGDNNTLDTKFYKIYEASNYVDNIEEKQSIYDILNTAATGTYKVLNRAYTFTTGFFNAKGLNTDIWKLTDENEEKWIDTIRQNTAFFIGDKFKVRVGIKSCADKVFIKKDWSAIKPEVKLIKTLLSQETVNKWCIKSELNSHKVLYPHYFENGKRQVYDIDLFPNAKKYLLDNYEILSARKYLIDGGRKWYELWVPQNPDLWKKSKIVFPDISVEPRFYFDDTGAIVNGNCYWITADSNMDSDILLLMQGVANSSIMTRYHDLCFNNKLYSGRRRYLSQYVEKYPMPNPDSKTSKEIIKLVKKINTISFDGSDISSLEQELDILVSKAFCILDR